MGRVEKKFQKKKDRERQVRKKILLKRAASRVQDKEAKKQRMLEQEADKKTRQPIRRMSPELQRTLELVEKIKEKETETDAAAAPPSLETVEVGK